MNVCRTGNFCVILGIIVGWCGGGMPARAGDAGLSADEIVRKAVTRAERAPSKSGQPGYTYTKLTVTEELDSSGKVKERKEKVYQVRFESGATYLKLLEVNGHAPGDADRKKQSENESNVRQIVGPGKNGKAAGHENFLTADLVAHFEFALEGTEVVNGRRAYHLKFHPRDPAAPTHHIVDTLLNRISGSAWVDAEEYEIARAEVYLGSEVNLLGGVIGSLKKLAYTMTRSRIAEGLWFNTSSSGDFEGRKLLDSTRIRTRSQASNFRPLG
jgi:hypothetical protein